MQSLNMNELNYDRIEKIQIELLPCDIELLIKSMETYAFIYHNIYSQHNDTDEIWLRDFMIRNLHSELMKYNSGNFKTNYDVEKNCENHANTCKRWAYEKAKKYYKKIA